MQAEEIKRHMQEGRQGMQDTESQVRASGEAVRREASEAQQQGDDLAREVRAPAPAQTPPHLVDDVPAPAAPQDVVSAPDAPAQPAATAPADTPVADAPVPPECQP